LPDQRDECLQHAIALAVAEQVIDALETIDIEQQQRGALPGASSTLDGGRQHVLHVTPVEGAGEWVGERLFLECAHAPLKDQHPDTGSGERRHKNEDHRISYESRRTMRKSFSE